jgi:homoprotocatechuate degradation regulator HpaR
MNRIARTSGDLAMEDDILPKDTNRSLPIALLRAREALMMRLRPLLACHGVTEQQWRVLRVLEESSPLDASELAYRACVLAPSLTRMIRSLEERRFINRSRDRADGRRTLLSLTPAGLAFINLVRPESRTVFAEIRKRYGAERIEQLVDMLNELATLELETDAEAKGKNGR